MTIEDAIEMLKLEYETAKMQAWIINPLAYALHQVWKKADKKRGRPRRKGES